MTLNSAMCLVVAQCHNIHKFWRSMAKVGTQHPRAKMLPDLHNKVGTQRQSTIAQRCIKYQPMKM